MNWVASENTDWFSINPISGTDSGTITASYDANPGNDRTGTITITAGNAGNSPQIVEVRQAGVISCDVKAVFVLQQIADISSE
ncbi:MAG: BACON domain-containing protein [Desulfobacterales bacterium]|nr:BACON domain-containing protein [Desulfobacterales bacterium]